MNFFVKEFTNHLNYEGKRRNHSNNSKNYENSRNIEVTENFVKYHDS